MLSWLIVTAILLLFVMPAQADEATIGGLQQTRWGSWEGAPNEPTSLVQTRDGYLWLGSTTGLYRFDALHFERFDLPEHPELAGASVFSLQATPDGGLWIGFTLKGIAFIKNGKVRTFDEAHGTPITIVREWGLQSDGTVWAGTSHGIMRLRNDRWESVGATVPIGIVTAMFVDGDDRVWAVSNDKLFVLEPKASTFVLRDQRLATPNEGFAQARDGSVWLTDGATLTLLAQTHSGRPPVLPPTSRLLIDHEGMVWTRRVSPGFVTRLARLPLAELTSSSVPIPRTKDPLQTERFLASGTELMEDDEGNVWVLDNRGVVRYRKSHLISLESSASWPYIEGVLIRSALAAGDTDDAWIMSPPEKGLYHFVHGRFEHVDGVPWGSAALRTASGTVWMGGPSGLWSIEAGRPKRHVEPPPGMAGLEVQSMAEDGEGGLWVSINGRSVYRLLANGQWQTESGVNGLPTSAPLVVAADREHRIWLGYRDGRLARVENQTYKLYDANDGLDIGPIFVIDARRSHLWLGGQRGIAFIDGGQLRTIEAESPQSFQNVTGLIETANGDLWLLNGIGLARVPAAEIAKAIANPSYRVSPQAFSVLEGLRGGASGLRPVPSLTEGLDGRLWAVTIQGIYIIDPTSALRGPRQPTVALRSLTADDRDYAHDAAVALPPYVSKLRFTYSGLSLTAADQLRYRYRLEGFDRDWQEVQDRREAFYTNLPPGQYRFHVQAGLKGAPWNTSEASMAFTIAPAFVQTRWFGVLCAAAAALAIYLLVQWRVRSATRIAMKRERERVTVRTAERERIAREIHDTLLQTTQAVVMMIDAAITRVRKGQVVMELLTRAAESGQQAVVEARNRIYELRFSEDEIDVARELNAIGERLAGEPAAARFASFGTPPPMAAPVARELVQIGSEALLNAYRHARACEVELRFELVDGHFILRVSDNGQGIREEVRALGVAAGHWGLPGMRERAKGLRGTLTVEPNPSGGTRVELRMPKSALLAFDAMSA